MPTTFLQAHEPIEKYFSWSNNKVCLSLIEVKKTIRQTWMKAAPLLFACVTLIYSSLPKGEPLQKSPFLHPVLNCSCGPAWGRGEGENVFGGVSVNHDYIHCTLDYCPSPINAWKVEHSIYLSFGSLMKSAWVCRVRGWWRNILKKSEWCDFVQSDAKTCLWWLKCGSWRIFLKCV